MAEGDIGSVIDTLEYDTADSAEQKIIHVSGNVFAIVYRGVGLDGWLVTVSIANDGTIGGAVIDSFEFDAVQSYYPDIIHVSGNVYAIAYCGVDFDGWLVTVSIANDGTIGGAVIDSFEFDGTQGAFPDIVHVSGNVFAIAYQGAGSDGWLVTVSIADDGTIGGAVIDSLEFDAAQGEAPHLVNISGSVYVIVYTGELTDGFLATVSIADDGTIGGAVIDSFEFDAVQGWYPDIIHISGNVFAIAYNGPDSDGWLITISISTGGTIGAVIDSFEFDAANTQYPNIIHISGNVFAIAYQGVDLDGWLVTVSIADDGTIGGAVIDSLEFDIYLCHNPSVIHISESVYAIAYTGDTSDGWLATMDIETILGGKVQHLMIMGVG